MNASKNDIKWVRSLQQKKFRKEHAVFVVEGKKMVEEALASGWKVHSCYSTEPAWAAQFNAQLVAEKDMASMSSLATPPAQLAVMHMPSSASLSWNSELVLVLDGIADPGNLGTLLRTAEWFGVKEVLLSENSVELFNPKTVQATMGSIFRVKCVYGSLVELLNQLKAHDYQLFGTLLHGNNLFEAKWTPKAALILGSESHGISESIQQVIDQPVTIPGYGNAESLNVSIAAAIAMAEWRRARSVSPKV